MQSQMASGSVDGVSTMRSPQDVQLVSCSATATKKLTSELRRLLQLDASARKRKTRRRGDEYEEDDDDDEEEEEEEDKVVLAIVTSTDPQRKRRVGARGIGGVGVPLKIKHSYVAVDSEADKPNLVASIMRSKEGGGLATSFLLFLDDSAPLKATVQALRDQGLLCV